MKNLLVITGLGMGGAEHVVVNLADSLVARGHQVKIAYLTGEALVLPSNKSVEVVAIDMKGSKNFLSAYFRLRKLISEFKPDVVHSHMIHANILARLLRLTVSIPKLICTAHNTNEGGRLRMLAYRYTDIMANISTNVSREAANAFVLKGAVKQNRMIVIANGIDIKLFNFTSRARNKLRHDLGISNKSVILAVGRLNAQKDYPSLFKAVQLLAEQRDDFKVFIAGDGPLKSELAQLVKDLYISDYIEFLGVRRDVSALMSAADLFVLSSAWEGFGLVVAEAMACERVVVATNCGGVREVVGEHGFLIAPGNNKLLAETLNNALSLSTTERSEIGAAARQHIIDNFSLDANVDAYLKLYNS